MFQGSGISIICYIKVDRNIKIKQDFSSSFFLSWFIQNEVGLMLRETVIKMLPSKAAVGRKVLEGEANAARQARLV